MMSIIEFPFAASEPFIGMCFILGGVQRLMRCTGLVAREATICCMYSSRAVMFRDGGSLGPQAHVQPDRPDISMHTVVLYQGSCGAQIHMGGYQRVRKASTSHDTRHPTICTLPSHPAFCATPAPSPCREDSHEVRPPRGYCTAKQHQAAKLAMVQHQKATQTITT